MKNLFVLVLLLLFFKIANTQGCLQQGITFSNQNEINNFQNNYPGCTEIMGDVTITGYDQISNLDGLTVLTTIGGSLQININSNLGNLSGLDHLLSVGGNVMIWQNSGLMNLSGLENLTSIGGDLDIGQNAVLNTLGALTNLQTVDGSLEIFANPLLTSLQGLENVDAELLADLVISDNPLLVTCGVESICSYLNNPKGHVDIYNNAEGCTNPPDIASSCGFTLTCLPYGDYYFLSQEDVDGFVADYSNCTQLEGIVKISGNDITNLDGLSGVTSLGFYLTIVQNPVLTNIDGLGNVNSVSGAVSIGYNPLLPDLSGLGNLSTIGGYLSVYNNNLLTSLHGLENLISTGGMLELMNNDQLLNLDALNNLTSIGGDLIIRHNIALDNLSGLKNINPVNLTSLIIAFNYSLGSCETQGICDYLTNPTGSIEIHDNAPGCNGQSEVETACETISVFEMNDDNTLSLSPNPANNEFIICTDSFPGMISIFNSMGEMVFEKPVLQHGTQINISTLPKGAYFVHFQDVKRNQVIKLIKR